MLADTLYVMTQGLLGQQVALRALTARVADHTGRTTHQRDGFMAAGLEMTQHHDAAQVTDMQTVRRRVDTYVRRRHFLH